MTQTKNEYGRFIAYLHAEANIQGDTYVGTCMGVSDMAEECGLTSHQVESYLERYQEEDDKFEYYLYTMACGNRGVTMCEYYFNL